MVVSRIFATVLAATGLGLAPASAESRLEDVLVGELGDKLRVALVCEPACDVVHFEDAVRVRGVRSDLKIDISSRSKLAHSLNFLPFDRESVLILDSAMPLEMKSINACETPSGAAICVDYVGVAASFPPLKPDGGSGAVAGAAESSPPAQRDLPYIGAAIAPVRETERRGLQFTPPERLAPPEQGRKIREGLDPETQTAEKNQGGPTPEPRIEPADPSPRPSSRTSRRIDLRSTAETILARQFEVGLCESARAKLQADAWALEAMIDLAYCKAADGDITSAEADFARLLAYTPDNYEALVGRALIALETGDADTARSLFQEALNALPPIEESERIVAVMDRL